MKQIIITIDGWSSCGKSTLARGLAKELKYVYIDSGAMYRAITLYFLRSHVDWSDNQSVESHLRDVSLEFHHSSHTDNSDIYLNGETWSTSYGTSSSPKR